MATAEFSRCVDILSAALSQYHLLGFEKAQPEFHPSPPLALFIVILSKAHLTSHSRISGSRWVVTASCLVVYKNDGLNNLLIATLTYTTHYYIQKSFLQGWFLSSIQLSHMDYCKNKDSHNIILFSTQFNKHLMSTYHIFPGKKKKKGRKLM